MTQEGTEKNYTYSKAHKWAMRNARRGILSGAVLMSVPAFLAGVYCANDYWFTSKRQVPVEKIEHDLGRNRNQGEVLFYRPDSLAPFGTEYLGKVNRADVKFIDSLSKGKTKPFGEFTHRAAGSLKGVTFHGLDSLSQVPLY